jgi:decaprenylphospho-beta-D-erythro-pentofuranosid-2-ulose 2-reductase
MAASGAHPPRVVMFGATSGIAAAVARIYAAAGASLVLVGRDAEAIAAAARDLRVRGAASVVEIAGDFAALDALGDLTDRAWSALSGADVALIAYGSLPEQTGLESAPGAAAPILALNFVSPTILALHLAQRFEMQRSGVLALITSVAGDRGRQSNYLYGAAKGGLQRLLEGLRHRLYPAGVQVLDIRPGFVATRMTDHLPQQGLLWAEPDRVAADIVRAIRQRRAVLYTPWFWRGILMIVRGLPRAVFHRTSL